MKNQNCLKWLSWEKKAILSLKMGPKWVRNEVFQVDQKLIHGIFLIFCMKLLYPKDLNLTNMICLWENHIRP